MSDIEKPDKVAAHRRAETIRSGIEGFAASKEAIAEAFEAHDWITLGHTSWGEYCKKEIGNKLRLPRADRDLAIQAFHELGMSVREIADALEVAKSTVQDALKPPPPKPSGSGHLPVAPADPLDAIPAAQDAVAAALANRSAPADEPEEDHPGSAGPGEVEDRESSTSDGGAIPSDAQPQSDVPPLADVDRDETAPQDVAPRQSSGPVDGQQPAGTGVSPPAAAPERSGGSEEQGRTAAFVPASPGKTFDEVLDEHAPDSDPHRQWRSAWLKAIKNAWGPASFAVHDIATNGNDETFAALIDVRDFYDELLTKVQAERIRIAEAAEADLPDNVRPIRRTA